MEEGKKGLFGQMTLQSSRVFRYEEVNSCSKCWYVGEEALGGNNSDKSCPELTLKPVPEHIQKNCDHILR